jgi:hypothetical protein
MKVTMHMSSSNLAANTMTTGPERETRTARPVPAASEGELLEAAR